MSWYPKKIDISTGESLTETELEYLDNITPGTVAATKAVVVSADKDAGDFRNLDCVNLDAGASGTAGTVDVFPTTASKGKIIVQCADNTTNHNLTITNAALNGASKTATFPAVSGYVAESTAALTLAEVDVLDGATAGTQVASKAVVADANVNIGVVKATELHIGATGAETQVTATGAELNLADGSVAGTAVASKLACLGADKNLDVLAVADLKLGAGAGTSITADATQLNSCDANIGAAAGTGVVAVETGFGNFKTTTLTFTDTPVVLADEAGIVAYGGLKVYDMPQGYIYMQAAVADLAITKSSAGVNADWDGDIGVGTVTASNNNTLAATEQNIIPTTATPQAVAGATTGDAVSTATEHAILDGTSAAVDVYVNLLVDDADHDVTTTPCNLILNGTLRLAWIFMGDN